MSTTITKQKGTITQVVGVVVDAGSEITIVWFFVVGCFWAFI